MFFTRSEVYKILVLYKTCHSAVANEETKQLKLPTHNCAYKRSVVEEFVANEFMSTYADKVIRNYKTIKSEKCPLDTARMGLDGEDGRNSSGKLLITQLMDRISKFHEARRYNTDKLHCKSFIKTFREDPIIISLINNSNRCNEPGDTADDEIRDTDSEGDEISYTTDTEDDIVGGMGVDGININVANGININGANGININGANANSAGTDTKDDNAMGIGRALKINRHGVRIAGNTIEFTGQKNHYAGFDGFRQLEKQKDLLFVLLMDTLLFTISDRVAHVPIIDRERYSELLKCLWNYLNSNVEVRNKDTINSLINSVIYDCIFKVIETKEAFLLRDTKFKRPFTLDDWLFYGYLVVAALSIAVLLVAVVFGIVWPFGDGGEINESFNAGVSKASSLGGENADSL